MSEVRPKKALGQHFLKDLNIAAKIADSLTGFGDPEYVLEIGPGTGVLTRFLLEKHAQHLYLSEIDRESVAYLKTKHPDLKDRILEGDFLKMSLTGLFEPSLAIIGNFPYNISSQIFFKVLENREKVTEVVCMIQKEVAQRIASEEGNKVYGILSVLLQTFYDIEYLFTVHEHVFHPEPKVKSAVIRLKRNQRKELGCDEKLYFRVVKQAFQTRRKTLRNALKVLNLPETIKNNKVFDLRAEQLSIEEFIELTKLIEKNPS